MAMSVVCLSRPVVNIGEQRDAKNRELHLWQDARKKYIEQERVYCYSALDYAGSNDANALNDEKQWDENAEDPEKYLKPLARS